MKMIRRDSPMRDRDMDQATKQGELKLLTLGNSCVKILNCKFGTLSLEPSIYFLYLEGLKRGSKMIRG